MSHDASRPISPDVRIGHVHLKVSDIDRALSFLPGILGFSVTQRYGTSAAFLSAGGTHHHIGLNTWESKDEGPPPLDGTSPRPYNASITLVCHSKELQTTG